MKGQVRERLPSFDCKNMAAESNKFSCGKNRSVV